MQSLYFRVLETNRESYPRVSYFKRRLKCIAPRMKRIIDYELQNYRFGNLRSVKQLINRLQLAIQQNVFAETRIVVAGDLKDEILRELKQNGCKECTELKNTEKNCLFVIGIELVGIPQLKDELDKILRKLAKNTKFPLSNFVLVLEHSVLITQSTLKAIQDIVEDIRKSISIELNCTFDFDIEHQLVLIPVSAKRPRPHSASEPSAKLMAVSATGSSQDIIQLSKHEITEEKQHRLVSSLDAIRKSPSPPLQSPHSPSKGIQQSIKTMKLDETISSADSNTTNMQEARKVLFSNEETVNPSDHVVTRSMVESVEQQHHKTPKVPRRADSLQTTHRSRLPQNDTDNSKPISSKLTEIANKSVKSKFNMNQAISYQFETDIIDLVNDIENVLQEIKTKRDNEKKEELFTTLDKLLFEIRGLYHQSITKKGAERKLLAEKMRMSSKLVNAILSINHVRGCGRIYGKINIHIEEVDDDKIQEIKTNIKTMVEKVTQPDPPPTYVVDTMSVPTLFGHMVICST